MLYDPSNPVVQLCVQGIETEYSGDLEKAHALYREAWQLANNELERLTAAHYLARVQSDAEASLKWNLIALEHAHQTADEEITAFYPSLYLNVAKCYEDMGNFQLAHDHYALAHHYAQHLPADGYGNMIRKGIEAGLERLTDR